MRQHRLPLLPVEAVVEAARGARSTVGLTEGTGERGEGEGGNAMHHLSEPAAAAAG